MKKVLLIAALTGIVFTVAFAQGRGMRGNRGPGFDGRNVAERLKLTDEQEKSFEKIRTEHEKNMISLRSKIQLARVDLRQLFTEENQDRKKVEEKVRDIGKLETDVKLARTGFWFDVSKILTPEQKKTWNDMPRGFGGFPGHGKMMHRGGGMKFRGGDDEFEDIEWNGDTD